MKTPDEILLAKHRAVEPKLDQIRAEVVAKLAAESPPESRCTRRSETRGILPGLRFAFGLVRAIRLNVGGLGAVWLLVFAFKLATPEPPINNSARSPASQLTMQAAMAEQQRLLAELNDFPVSRVQKETPKPDVPRPRSELRHPHASA